MLYGANADSCDSKGYTPISHASSAGSSANLIELLDSGHADVHITANNGKTALYCCHGPYCPSYFLIKPFPKFSKSRLCAILQAHHFV